MVSDVSKLSNPHKGQRKSNGLPMTPGWADQVLSQAEPPIQHTLTGSNFGRTKRHHRKNKSINTQSLSTVWLILDPLQSYYQCLILFCFGLFLGERVRVIYWTNANHKKKNNPLFSGFFSFLWLVPYTFGFISLRSLLVFFPWFVISLCLIHLPLVCRFRIPWLTHLLSKSFYSSLNIRV